MITPLPEFKGLNSCINITQKCNLRCKYCYENKSSGTISIDDAKKFIDLLLTDHVPIIEDGYDPSDEGLILDLLGGDALMYPNLVDEICTYLEYKLNLLDHPWKDHWRINITSNGTFFNNPDVRKVLLKWKRCISLGVSIDGCPEIHDMYRVFPNGEGSLDKILEGFNWYRNTFPIDSLSTKSTCSKESIPYLYKSLVYLHETLGLKYINQNFIMEDSGCTESDYELLDKELSRCVDYVFNNRNNIYWSMIDDRYRTPTIVDDLNKSQCGSGCMPCLGIDGKIYPCFRWLPLSMHRDSSEFILGDINHGYNNPAGFLKVQECNKKCNCLPKMCKECNLSSICPYCIAGSYDELGKFERTTHNCRFIKLQNKWADIYWRRFDETGEARG